MPCIHHLPPPHGDVACVQCRSSPWPSAQPLHSGEMAPGRCSHPGLIRGGAERITSATGRHSLPSSAPTYLSAHASLALTPPRKGHTGHAARGPFDSRRSRPLRRARADSTSHTCQAGASPSKRRRRANSTGLLNAPSPQSTGQNLPRRVHLLRRAPPASAFLEPPIKRVPEPL